MQKVTTLIFGIIGSQVVCKAAGTASGNENNLNTLVVIIAISSLVISLISLALTLYIKRKNTVDLVNTTEDYHLSLDSLKTTLGKDIKNVRKEINRNYRRDNQKQVQHQAEKAKITGEDDETQEIKPAPNRKLPHKKHYSRGRSFVKPKPNKEGGNTAE